MRIILPAFHMLMWPQSLELVRLCKHTCCPAEVVLTDVRQWIWVGICQTRAFIFPPASTVCVRSMPSAFPQVLVALGQQDSPETEQFSST